MGITQALLMVDAGGVVASGWDIATEGVGGTHSLSNSNRTDTASATQAGIRGTLGYATNAGLDRYFEITWDASVTATDLIYGIANTSIGTSGPGVANANGRGYYQGAFKFDGSFAAYGATFTTGDVLGCRMNGTAITFYKNGTSQGLAFTMASDGTLWYPCWAPFSNSGTRTVTLNTGQAAFVTAGMTAWG
jgi:hypothetical protein